MKDKKIQIQKVCGFYVNDWHFTTMILPYMKRQIEGNKRVITFFQNTIQSNIKEMLSKMNLNKNFEEKILKTNWNKAICIKQEEIEQNLEIVEENTKTIDILVKGDNEFIETINQKIEKAIQNLNLEKQVTMINFYDLSNNDKIDQITEKHEYIMNTAGIQKISNNSKEEEKKQA